MTKHKSAQPRGKKQPKREDPWKKFPKLPPDDPLYQRGWIIGIKRSHTTKPERPPGLDLFNVPSWLPLDEMRGEDG
jgi:hypothetical protein